RDRPARRDRCGAGGRAHWGRGAHRWKRSRDHANDRRSRAALRRPRGRARPARRRSPPVMAAPARPLLTLPQLAHLAGGDLWVRDLPSGAAAREVWLASGVSGASIDTRTLEPGQLFVPLPGARADGHAFIGEAFARGAAAALCDRTHAAEWQEKSAG